MENPVDTKVHVKPIVIVPEDIPRNLGEKAPSREEALRMGQDAADGLRQRVGDGVEVLGPSVIETRDDVSALGMELGKTDVYWVLGAGRGRTTLILEIARRYSRPLVGGGGVGLSPFLRSKGFEAYPTLDDDLLSLLRVKKAIGLTKALLVQSKRFPGGCLSGAWNLTDVEARLGVGFEFVSDEMLFAQLEQVDWGEARSLAEGLISGATAVDLDPKYVVNSAALYLAARKLMDGYGCNALSVGCCESPFLELEAKHETTPCLALTLLNDQGLLISCQGDLSALLTVMVLTYLARKAVFMGNLGVPDREKSLLSVSHSAPGLRLNGLGAPRLPYSLHSFGVMDWGTAVYVDMTTLKGEVMTIARFDPLVRKLLVTKGELVESFPVERFCKQMIHVQVPDAAGFLRRAYADYGAHLTVVSGDYVRRLGDLAELLGLELEVVA